MDMMSLTNEETKYICPYCDMYFDNVSYYVRDYPPDVENFEGNQKMVRLDSCGHCFPYKYFERYLDVAKPIMALLDDYLTVKGERNRQKVLQEINSISNEKKKEFMKAREECSSRVSLEKHKL